MPPSPAAAKPDIIVIGTGQAGVPLATRLAAAGKHVVIVERGNPGGTCVNIGCTPTKTLIASARAAHVARTSERLGVRVGGVAVDFAAVMARKDAIVQRWRASVERRLQAAGDHLRFVRGHASFVAPRTVEVNGERLFADHIVVNVGARSAVPDIPGLAGVAALDSTSVLELSALPEKLLVVGAGYVACEMAQLFRRLGSQVTLVARSSRLLPREDEAASEALATVFRAEGIELELRRRVLAATSAPGGVELRLTATEGNEADAWLRGTNL
ncbi:MAG TPA: FAD-dependent oxidoreductase, partial [Polyangia bacterium]